MAQVLQQVRHAFHELLLPQASAVAVLVSILLIIIVCPLLLALLIEIVRRPWTTAATARRRTISREQLLSKLPSPPSRRPIIGHLYLVGSLPHGSLRDLAVRHGRNGLMLLRLGAIPTLVMSSPLTAASGRGCEPTSTRAAAARLPTRGDDPASQLVRRPADGAPSPLLRGIRRARR